MRRRDSAMGKKRQEIDPLDFLDDDVVYDGWQPYSDELHDYSFYHDYINSPEWKRRSAQVKARQGNTCLLCGKQGSLHTHHLTYRHLGDETDDDCVALCAECHQRVTWLAKHYHQACYAHHEEALAWAWHDAKLIIAIPQKEPCILCNVSGNLDTSYNEATLMNDLAHTCAACRWDVFCVLPIS